MIWRMWLLLLQVKRRPQSSNACPNCPPPETASNAEPSGRNRKSRPRTETGFASGRDLFAMSPPLPPETPYIQPSGPHRSPFTRPWTFSVPNPVNITFLRSASPSPSVSFA